MKNSVTSNQDKITGNISAGTVNTTNSNTTEFGLLILNKVNKEWRNRGLDSNKGNKKVVPMSNGGWTSEGQRGEGGARGQGGHRGGGIGGEGRGENL